MSLFSGGWPDLISLAEDEARMLGSAVVDPEHLLLAFARQGRVRELLRDQGIGPAGVYAAVVDARGVGDELVLGRLPRSRASDRVLKQAVETAFGRGERRPSDELICPLPRRTVLWPPRAGRSTRQKNETRDGAQVGVGTWR